MDQHDPTIEAVNRYRLAMSRVQAAAMMFMAAGSGSAANDVRDAAADAAVAMQAVLAGPAPDAIKADARLTDSIGKAIAGASIDLIGVSRQLDAVVDTEIETTSQDMQSSFDKLVQTAADRQRSAAATARAAGRLASRNILMMGRRHHGVDGRPGHRRHPHPGGPDPPLDPHRPGHRRRQHTAGRALYGLA